MKRIVSTTITCASLVMLASGCIDGPAPQRPDVTSDTPQPDGESDVPTGAVAIDFFRSNHAIITRGTNHRGLDVQGAATLSWRAPHAHAVVVSVDGVPIALDGCAPSGDAPCAEAGSITVRPSQSTTFTLRAEGPGGTCDGTCPEASVSVAVRPPARVSLTLEPPIVPPGMDALITYAVEDATDWAIGLVDRADPDRPTLHPCQVGDVGEAPCTLPAGDDGAEAEGHVRVRDVQRDFRVAATASNGADDGLGDIGLGELHLDVTVPVVIHRFTATPEALLPGGSATLAWEVGGAQAVQVTADVADPSHLTGLTTCVGLGEDGAGFCTVRLHDNAPLGPVRLVLEATQDTGSTGEAQAGLEVIAGPKVARFVAVPDIAVPGQDVTIAWTAFGADAIALSGASGAFDGLADCDELPPSGRGSCVVTVRAGASLDTHALTLTASHTEVGPPASAHLSVDVVAPPVVLSFDIADPTIEAGAPLSLTWEVEDAELVLLTDSSGSLPAGDLARCAASMSEGDGMCTLDTPESLEPGSFTLSLVAVGPTGARSAPTERTVTIGLRPSVQLTASPSLLPEGGGLVTLSWDAPRADRVRIVDDATPPLTLVDTDAGTTCGTTACRAEGDTFSVMATRSTTWTVLATNDFGQVAASASANLEGAPLITALTADGADATAGPVLIGADSATVAWTISNGQNLNSVTLDRAPLPVAGADCQAVDAAAWMPVSGFPSDAGADGSFTVVGTVRIAECFRLTASDTDTIPPQRDSVRFKLYRAPAIQSVTVDDDSVQHGDTVRLSWTTRHARRVAVSATPVGAVTSQELASCNVATGSCDLMIQPGTPLGDVTLRVVASGEEGTTSAPTEVRVTIGVGARVASLTASASSMSAEGDVLIRWTTTDGTALTLRDRDTELFATGDAAVVQSGEFLVEGVTTSTTWTLTVSNAFGADSAQVTTFVGPSIDALTANGQSALGGQATVVTGPVSVGWTTTSADGSHVLETAIAPANGNCAASGLSFETVYAQTDAPATSATHALGTVTTNLCVRLTVANSQSPPQASSATFLLREIPEITRLQTAPSQIASSGGTVIVSADVRGASGLTLSAQYRDASGAVLGTRSVCNQNNLNSGSLSGGAALDTIECAHSISPCNLFCLNSGMPSGTTHVRYVLNVSDQEGDSASANTAGGEDVAVQ